MSKVSHLFMARLKLGTDLLIHAYSPPLPQTPSEHSPCAGPQFRTQRDEHRRDIITQSTADSDSIRCREEGGATPLGITEHCSQGPGGGGKTRVDVKLVGESTAWAAQRKG